MRQFRKCSRRIASTTFGVLDNFAKREIFKAQMKFAFLDMAMPDLRDFFPSLPDTYDPESYQTEAEMVANIFFFNVMGQDDASGKFTLDNDKPQARLGQEDRRDAVSSVRLRHC